MFFFFNRVPEAFNSGYLPQADGHLVYFHEFGNPKGYPVLVFHGGPGSCSKPRHAQLFNLKKNRIIMFDQRGCGKSLPSFEIKHNSLQDIVEDARRLLDMLAVKKAAVYGGSWGAVVGLVFAETYPARVDRLVITKTFLGRKRDIEWISSESARFYPDIMARIMSEVPAGGNARGRYAQLALSESLDDRQKAAGLYGSYERMLGQTLPAFAQEPPTEEHMNAFRLYMHYDSNDYGLSENQVLANAGVLSGIPALIAHNRLDMVCPVEQSWELHRALKGSRLVIVPDTGHSSALLDKTVKRELESFLKEEK